MYFTSIKLEKLETDFYKGFLKQMEYYLRNSSVTKSQVLSKHLEAGNVCVIRVYICFCFITSFK